MKDAILAGIERGSRSDRLFFRRRPDRSYRVRRSFKGEAEGLSRKPLPPLPPDLAWFMVVRQAEEGMRFRLVITGPADYSDEATEDEARWLFHDRLSALCGEGA